MSDWKPYSKNRKSKEQDGFLLIVPADFEESLQDRMPIFCDVCELAFSRPDDVKSFKKFKCCSICADTWAYSRQEEWKNGWRPSSQQVEASVDKRNVVDSFVRFE